jgi:hypothetical protein
MGTRGRVSRRKKPSRPYRVFVSHATADKWIARTICEKLEARGVPTFRDDRDIKGGDDIPEEIQRELSRSDELLVLLTPNSVNRPWVVLEVGMALARKRRIIPVLCHVSVDPIPAMIRSKKAYELNEVDRYFDEVCERMTERSK